MLAMLLALIISGEAFAGLPPKFGGSLSIRLKSRIAVLDPTLATRPDEFNIVFAIFEPLVRAESKTEFTPVLLEALPQVSDDGMTYYFKLKEDIHFHDGSVLDPGDVLNSIQRLVKSRRSPYSWLFACIQGAPEYRRGKAKSISGFKIVDTQRFEIALSRKNSNFIKYLTLPAAVIVSSPDHDFRPPVGTGPFRFSANKGSDILLAYNGDYHEGRPYLDSLHFVVVRNDDNAVIEYKAGRLDVADVPLDGLKKDDEKLLSGETRGGMKSIFFIDLNPMKPYLAKSSNRRNISLILDRKSIVGVVMNGRGRIEDNIGQKPDDRAVKSPAAEELSLWYPDSGKSLEFLSEKVVHDMARIGLLVKPSGVNQEDIGSFTASAAPAMILRSLPLLLDMPETIEKTLFNQAGTSQQSTLGLRLDEKTARAVANERNLVIFLFSQNTSYMRRAGIQNFNLGPFNEIDLQDVYIRHRSQ